MNDKCEKITKNISKLVSQYFHKTKLIVAFKAPAEIGHSFPFKDKIKDKLKQSLVVYQINCKQCEATYIGKTVRILSIRINEHTKLDTSAVKRHKDETKHSIDYENPVILDRANNDLKLCYKEMLHIRQSRPTLNKQEESELFTLIIRNTHQKNSITRDIQKYVGTNKIKKNKNKKSRKSSKP